MTHKAKKIKPTSHYINLDKLPCISQIKDIQSTIDCIIYNLNYVNLDKKIELLKYIKLLLESNKMVSDTRNLSKVLRENTLDFDKLMYLKGRILFMKNRMEKKNQEPENVINLVEDN